METSNVNPREASEPSTACCPRFDPTTWQDKEVTWQNKPFVKEHVHSMFHVPLDMARKMTKSMRLIDEAHASSPQRLMLSDEQSPWGSDLYIDVTGPVPGANMATLSGTFMTRVYEGSYGDAPKWAEDMHSHVAKSGRTLRKLYFAYTTCPRCAKAYGKNYVVLFAQVS